MPRSGRGLRPSQCAPGRSRRCRGPATRPHPNVGWGCTARDTLLTRELERVRAATTHIIVVTLRRGTPRHAQPTDPTAHQGAQQIVMLVVIPGSVALIGG